MASTRFSVVIPARFGSSRLPGKPLADIGGKPMVVHVAERARESGARLVVVATDDDRIEKAVRSHGFEAVMTRADHASGTDRLAEVVGILALDDDSIVVNVQGDEPFVEPAMVRELARLLEATPEASIATACHPITDADEFFNPNVVKVVLDAQGYARYFSRAPIPWARDAFSRQDGRSLPGDMPAYRHIGVYSYRAGFLRRYTHLVPSPLERLEALEQLRALWHGFSIAVQVVPESPVAGIDTPEDLERARARFDRTLAKR